jgi:hypothetical protein
MSDLLEIIGLACREGGSDKVWGAALLNGTDGKVTMLSVYGKRGIVAGKPKVEEFIDEAAARNHYWVKVNEKLKKSPPYISFDLSLPGYGVLDTLAGLDPRVRGDSSGTTTLSIGNGVSAPKARRITVSHLSVARPDQIERLMQSEQWGLAEKANGERRTVERFEDGTLAAYNRKGERLPSVPESAKALTQIQTPFLVDGEAMPGGGYAMFDLLELGEFGADKVRGMAFQERINLLEAMTIGLIAHGPALPDDADTCLFVLIPVKDALAKQHAWASIKAKGGEGVVLRDMRGPSIGNAGVSRYELKVKFQAEIDAFVIGGKDGRAGGSLRLGLIRPGPRPQVIEVSTARSGFNDEQIAELVESARNGYPAVLRVQFLPARTVGYRLVEPKTGPTFIRTDKIVSQCTTDQLVEILGEDCLDSIALAPAAR